MSKSTLLGTALADVGNHLNCLGGEWERIQVVQGWFGSQHRTLQQQFVKVVIVPVLQHLADAHHHGWTDGRNEAAASLAVKMLAAVTDDDLFLPLI